MVKQYQISDKQRKNLYACMNEINAMDVEVERARKAGVTIPDDVTVGLEECRTKVYNYLKFYGNDGDRKVLSNG